jgi:hypothetical protein
MIRLTIKHSFVKEMSATHYQATYFLRDHTDPQFNPNVLDERLAQKRLSDLARTWFLLNRTGNERDANEELLSGHPDADATVAELLPLPKPGFFRSTSDDPILLAAVDERVRRACAVLFENEVCDAYLRANADVFFPLSDPRAKPSGRALPDIPAEIREKVAESS